MEIEKLLKKLPKTKKREWSYLETIGVSHRETIMANLLAFYFDPSEKHGLGDLFIRALLQTQPKRLDRNVNFVEEKNGEGKWPTKFDWAYVTLEDTTGDNKRIDILIETEKLVIAIEFKINHELNNPLSSYVDYIEDKGKEKKKHGGKEKYYIVLTPYWKEPVGAAKIKTEFKQMMLSHFVEKVKCLVKKEDKFASLDEASQHMFYTDFLNTIENRKIRTTMINDYFEKAKNEITGFSHRDIEQAFVQFKDLKLDIEKETEKLLKLLNEKPENKFSIMGSSKDEIQSVLYCAKGDKHIKVRLTLEGWTVELWGKDGKLKTKELGDFKRPLEQIVMEIEEWSYSFNETSWTKSHGSEV